MLNNAATIQALDNIPLNSTVFVSYIPGRKPTQKAYDEAYRATVEEGINPRHFTGKLSGWARKRNGEVYFTLWVEERDSTSNGQVVQGAYRAFNPTLGKLLTLEVIQKA